VATVPTNNCVGSDTCEAAVDEVGIASGALGVAAVPIVHGVCSNACDTLVVGVTPGACEALSMTQWT
jgi:hypothetical protein